MKVNFIYVRPDERRDIAAAIVGIAWMLTAGSAVVCIIFSALT